MGTIYIARSDVVFGYLDTTYEHLFLVYDEDGNTSTLGDQTVITAGPSGTGIPSFGELTAVYDEDIYNLSYGSSSDPASEFTYMTLYSGVDAESVWNGMVAYADDMTEYDQNHGFSTGLTYNPFSINSNSFINSILSEAGFDLRDNFPTNFPASEFPGNTALVDGQGDNILTAYTYDSGEYTFYDNAGKDYFIIENGASATITKDDIENDWNNIVLSGYSAEDYQDLYLIPGGGLNILNLEIRSGLGIFDDLVLNIKDHFEPSSLFPLKADYNSKYLFVVENNISVDDIDIVTDTVSNTNIYNIIDLHLLSDYLGIWGSTFGVSLDSIRTATIDQPDITGSSVDNYMFGDEYNNIITGAGGNDVLYGGAGDDTLSFGINEEEDASYADGGAGFDYFEISSSASNSNIELISSSSIETYSGSIDGVEGIKLSANVKNIYVSELGWTYDYDAYAYINYDYASINESLTIDVSSESWTVTGNVSSTVDSFYDYAAFSSASFASIVGSNYGDTYEIDYDRFSLYLGSGDDTVTLDASLNPNINYNRSIYYTAGNDVIENANNFAFLYFSGGIDVDDLSFSENNVVYQSTTSATAYIEAYKTYELDMIVSVSGKGTLTLQSVNKRQYAGEDGVFDTADDHSNYLTKLSAYSDAGYGQIHFTDDGVSSDNSGPFIQRYGAGGNDVLTGDSSANTMYGRNGDDTLNGGGGNDYLYGEGGNDLLNGGDNNDLLYGDLGDDVLNGNDGNDQLYGNQGNDVLDGGDGDDTIYGENGDDILIGGAGNSDRLYGGNGNDQITAINAQTLYGGTGNDTIEVSGSATNVYGDEGDDQILVNNGSTVDAGAGEDNLEITGNVSFVYGGEGDDTIEVSGSSSSIYGDEGNDTIIITGTAITLYGGEGDDYLEATNGSVKFYGGEGENTLHGVDTSSATYYLEGLSTAIYAGDGTDDFKINSFDFGNIVIFDNGTNLNDKISIYNGGLYFTDFSFVQDGDDLVITYLPDDNSLIRIVDHYIDSSQIDSFTTDELGTVSLDLSAWISGSVGEETIMGTSGADFIVSNGGADTLIGDAGNDKLVGSAESNYLIGGLGSDTIYSGLGDDVIYYESSLDLGDIIRDVGGNDTILFGSQIDIRDISFLASSSTLNIYVQNNSMTLVNQLSENALYSDWGVEYLQFENGFTFNLSNYEEWYAAADNGEIHSGSTEGDVIIGGAGDDELSGLAGDDYIDGGNGADIINSGEGEDLIYADASDTVDGGDDFDIVSFAYSTSAVQVNLATGAVTDSSSNSGSIVNTESIIGSDFDDSITGDALDNILVGGDGGDILYGGDGIDTVDYSDAANGVTLSLHAKSSSDDGYGNIDTYHSIENVIGSDFADTISGSNVVNEIWGMGGDDFIYGYSDNDTLWGGSGNDELRGNDGNDILYGEDGADAFYGGNGNDTIYAGDGNDVTVWGQSGDDIMYGGEGDDYMRGGDDNDILYGDNGLDILQGESGDDTLYGGAGSDSLIGGSGADIFALEYAYISDIESIVDFSLSDNDAIDISDLLFSYDPLNDIITDFVQITDNGTDSILAIDLNGGADSFSSVATLTNVTGLTDEAALEASGYLITV